MFIAKNSIESSPLPEKSFNYDGILAVQISQNYNYHKYWKRAVFLPDVVVFWHTHTLSLTFSCDEKYCVWRRKSKAQMSCSVFFPQMFH